MKLFPPLNATSGVISFLIIFCVMIILVLARCWIFSLFILVLLLKSNFFPVLQAFVEAFMLACLRKCS